MSSKLNEYRHVFDTWEFYPRVHHFLKRYRGVLRQCRKLLGNMPHSKLFDSQTLLKKLEDSSSLFEAPLEVTVIGRTDLDLKDLVIRETTSEDTRIKSNRKGKQALSRTGKGIHIVICHVIIDDFEEKTIKKTVKAISEAEAALAVPSGNGAFLVYCQFSKKKLALEEKRVLFRKEVIRGLCQKTRLNFDSKNFITDINAISSRISLLLETQIVLNLQHMKWPFNNFTSPTMGNVDVNDDILERKEFLSIMQAFLRNGLGFVDMLEDTGDKTFKELVFSKLGRIVRCSVVDLLASKYGISQDICNQIAHQVNFEDEIKKSISKNTTYHLSKLEQPCKDYAAAVKSGNSYFTFQGFRFVFIAYQIRDDIKKAVKVLEASIGDLVKFTDEIHRVAFEIDGYLRQSKADVDCTDPPNASVIKQKLRTAILSVDGVYGMGTIYGVVEVHLRKGAIEESVKGKIKEVMKQHRFSYPYRTRLVIKEPVHLAIEHGHEVKLHIEANELPGGTLGCFLEDKEKNLFAITSAHVVRGMDNSEHDVKYNGEEEQHDRFAKSNPTWMYQDDAAIDIAAVKVREELKSRCKKRLKDDEMNERNWEFFADTDETILRREVYKHGSSTKLTKGLIVSVDYSFADAPDKNQLVSLMSNLAGDDGNDVSYAKQGDSGAVNCLSEFFEDTTHPIKALSVISKGDFKVLGCDESMCVSFNLREGLTKLPIQLNPPT